MADLAKTIQIIFESVDNLSGDLNSIGSGISGFADGVGRVTGPLADLSATVLTTVSAMGALGAGMLAWSVNEAGKFQTATAEINTLIGLSPELLREFEDQILAYSRNSTSAFEDINQAVYQAISTGSDYTESLVRVAAAESLADAGRAGLVESTMLLSQTMNAYGAVNEEVERYVDALFRTVQVGATTIPELAASFASATGSAAALNIPVEMLGAAFASVTAQGASTSEAATRINAVLTALIRPSVQASAAAAELGLEFSAAAVQTRGLDGVLDDVMRTTGGNVESLSRLFGSTEAVKGVLALTAESAAGLNSKFLEFTGITGITAAAAAEMAAAFEAVNLRIQTAFREIGIRAGREFLETYSEIAEQLRAIFYGLADGIDSGAFDPLIDLINEFGENLRDVFADIARNLPDALELIDFGGFESALRALAAAVGSLFDGIDVSTPEGLANAIQEVINVGRSLILTAASIVEALKPFIDAALQAASAYGNAGEGVLAFGGGILGLAQGINAVLPAVGMLGSGVEALGNGLSLLAGASLAKTIAGLSGAGGLAAASGAAATAVGALPPVIAAAGAALGAFQIGRAISEMTGFREASEAWLLSLRGIPPVIGASDEAVARSVVTLQGLADEMGLSSLSMTEFNRLADSGKLIWDETTQKWVQAGSAAKDLGESFEAIAVDELVAEFNLLNPSLQLTADGTVKAADATDALSTTTRGLVSVFDAATGKWIDIADAADKGADSVKDGGEELKAAAEKAELMTRASADFILGWEQIQSAERVAIFEARADIAVAQIEADASRTIAAFDAMSSSFENTGDVLTELFGIWAGLDSGFDKNKIAEWIEREYKIREDLAKSQIALVEAEIKRMEAQTALLERGGVEIKISSDGLDTHLEAFMLTIIDRVRVQVAGSYEDFLLGCGS